MAFIERLKTEDEEKWMEWVDKLPWLNFKKEWNVKVIPPFAGAIARFQISLDDGNKTFISVYFDGFDKLGWVGKPYWEIYPVESEGERETARFLLGQEKEMLNLIDKELQKQLNYECK